MERAAIGSRAEFATLPTELSCGPLEHQCAWLVESLKIGHPAAPALLFDRFATDVERVLTRVLGWDEELPDLLHDVFAVALKNIKQLDDPQRLRSWLCGIAVYTARGCIRARKRWRLLRSSQADDVSRMQAVEAGEDVREAMRRTYRLLERLTANERIAFALRFIDGMQLTEVAEICSVSLATVKRRLAKAEKRFVTLAQRDPVLRGWLERGRWSDGATAS